MMSFEKPQVVPNRFFSTIRLAPCRYEPSMVYVLRGRVRDVSRFMQSCFGRTWMVALSLLTIVGCGRPAAVPVPLTLTGETQGTTYTVRLAKPPSEITKMELQAEIDDLLECIDDEMSNWDAESEVSRFNRYKGMDWFNVSPETAFVVAAAMDMSQQSGGAFDVTVGPLVELWGFGSGPAKQSIPSNAEVEAALQRVGWRAIDVRLSPPALRKSRGDIQIDLSGVAQGFTVDRLADLLDRKGAESYFVEIGGEIRTRGRKLDGTGWRIGIELPAHDATAPRRLHQVVVLENQSLATSGDYRHYREINGIRYSHTIDPRTGHPIEHRLASVSVIAETCIQADALATTLMVLGPEKGYNWAVKENIAALCLIHDGNNLIEQATPAFRRIASQ